MLTKALKNTTATLVLLGLCSAPLAALAQQYNRHDDNRDNRENRQNFDNRDNRDSRGGHENYDRDNHNYVRHDDWKRGYHMRHEDWDRGQRVDYRTYHLRRPPAGYQWREVDGNFVLGAVSTGIIASIIAANAAHH